MQFECITIVLFIRDTTDIRLVGELFYRLQASFLGGKTAARGKEGSFACATRVDIKMDLLLLRAWANFNDRSSKSGILV